MVFHAVAAIIAFGAMALSGVYGSMAQRLGRTVALEEVRRYFAKPLRTEAAVLAVAPLGVAALLIDPRGSGMDQLWVGAALILWIVASVLWLAVVHPAETAIGRAAAGTGPERDHPSAGAIVLHGKRLARASAVTDIVFVLALALMVFQPA